MTKRAPKPAAKKANGRPTTYTDEIAATICTRLGDGQSLKTICTADDMPAQSTVYLWLQNVPGFSEKYARARETQASAYADEIVDIADTEKDPQKARVRIDARKWHASKLAPKKYGDFNRTELSTADDKPLRMDVTLTPAEAYARALKP